MKLDYFHELKRTGLKLSPKSGLKQLNAWIIAVTCVREGLMVRTSEKIILKDHPEAIL